MGEMSEVFEYFAELGESNDEKYGVEQEEVEMKKRYWVSWWSGNVCQEDKQTEDLYEDEGCSEPPFQVWVSGQRERKNFFGDRDECSMCAVIDSESEDRIWEVVEKHYPDYEERFCEERESNFEPGDRFPGFENRVSLE